MRSCHYEAKPRETVKNSSAELSTFYIILRYCTILRVNLIGLEGEGTTILNEEIAREEEPEH